MKNITKNNLPDKISNKRDDDKENTFSNDSINPNNYNNSNNSNNPNNPNKKAKRGPIQKSIELLFFSLIIGAINIYFHSNPGFFQTYFNPYLVLSLIVSSYYGKYYGFLSLLFSTLIILLLLPFALDFIYPGTWSIQYWINIKSIFFIQFCLSLAGVYIFGIIRDSIAQGGKKEKELKKSIYKEKEALIKGLEIVNRELEERVSRQEDSVSALYTWLHKLYTLNLEVALEAILETVQKFSGATKASIWEYNHESKELTIVKNIGRQTKEKIDTVISADNSIEGWVVRNNMPFSVKLLLQYNNLRNLDTGRNLITLPLMAGRNIWGVLNIEEMPFSKYNIHTEELLHIIMSLVGPSLEKAVEFESVIKQAEINQYTGLPSFSHFYSILEKELNRMILQKGTLSIIIIELINFDDLVKEFGEEKSFILLANILEELEKYSKSNAGIFHYKSDNQLVLLSPNLDYDGSSLLCLQILETVNSKNWEIDEKSLFLEIVLGYAALGEKSITVNEMLKIAENLLEMQKI